MCKEESIGKLLSSMCIIQAIHYEKINANIMRDARAGCLWGVEREFSLPNLEVKK